METWKEIEGFSGYFISDEGRVRSSEVISSGQNYSKITVRIKPSYILKPMKTNCGYYRVCLYKDGKQYYKTIHRLVAEAFIPNPNNLPCVNHKDEDKFNNNVENLEWCTSLYNNTYNDIHLRRKRYTHRYQYELDKVMKNVRDVLSEIDMFKKKYPDVPINEMIEELKNR